MSKTNYTDVFSHTRENNVNVIGENAEKLEKLLMVLDLNSPDISQ